MSIRATLAIILCPVVADAAIRTNDFQFARSLSGPIPTRTEVVAAEFDPAIFQSAADDFADVRIMDDRGAEIPRAVEKATTLTTRVIRQAVSARAVALKELPDNRIEAEFTLAEAADRADGFDLRTPLRDFVRAVTVQGSSGETGWQPLVSNAEIFDYQRYLDVRNTTVALPSNSHSRFLVEIGNAAEERAQPLIKLVQQSGGRDTGSEIRTLELLRTPFRMDGLDFWRNTVVADRQEELRREYELPASSNIVDAVSRCTHMTLRQGRIPLNRLTVDIQTRNFSRAARIQTRVTQNGVVQWRDIATGRLISVDLPGYSRQDLTMNFPEVRAEELRLVIENGDNPPLAGIKVRGYGPVYRTLLLAEPGRSYRCLYGAGKLAAPSYELDALLAPVRHGLQPPIWTLGAPEENPAYQARSNLLDWLNSPVALTAAIIVMALALLLILARSLKRVGQKLDSGEGTP